uniref:Ig-like domain-containing protein n=1 Tax=Ascaris lumbricoides TaxID=6252 RepID=A0A0M3HWM1_ASCLU
MRIIWAKSGKPAILQCSVPMPNDDNFSLEWRKHRKLVFSAYGNASGHAAPEMQVQKYIGQLLLSSVTLPFAYNIFGNAIAK